MLTMMLFLLVALTGIHSGWSRRRDSSIGENIAGDVVHTVPLGSEATFHWRCDFEIVRHCNRLAAEKNN